MAVPQSYTHPSSLRKHMKVHGKEAVCQFDSEESDCDEASSPSSSLVSSGHTPGPHPTPHMGEWYCGEQAAHPTHHPTHHTAPTNKFEAHQHSIGGLIGSSY